jgi:hypothetical protein
MQIGKFKGVIASALLLTSGIFAVEVKAQDAKRRQHDRWVPIVAFTDQPLADADILVSRADGRTIFEKDHATNGQGF